MQWEYKLVLLDTSGGIFDSQDKMLQQQEETLNILGKAGWEAVSYSWRGFALLQLKLRVRDDALRSVASRARPSLPESRP